MSDHGISSLGENTAHILLLPYPQCYLISSRSSVPSSILDGQTDGLNLIGKTRFYNHTVREGVKKLKYKFEK